MFSASQMDIHSQQLSTARYEQAGNHVSRITRFVVGVANMCASSPSLASWHLGTHHTFAIYRCASYQLHIACLLLSAYVGIANCKLARICVCGGWYCLRCRHGCCFENAHHPPPQDRPAPPTRPPTRVTLPPRGSNRSHPSRSPTWLNTCCWLVV